MDRTLSQGEAANRRLIENVYALVLQPLDSTRVDEFIAPDYIQHNPMAETGAAGLKRFLDQAKAASPDAVHHVKRILVDGDFVVGHVHVIINPGDRGHIAIDIFRIENGRVAEHWDAIQPIGADQHDDNGVF